jgi:hypothetical protein
MTCITFLLTYLVAFKSPCELRINLKLLRLSFHQQQDLQYHLNKFASFSNDYVPIRKSSYFFQEKQSER